MWVYREPWVSLGTAWSCRDFMLATCVNLPRVEATPGSRGLTPCGQWLFADCAYWNCTARQGANWCRIPFRHILWHWIGVLNKDQYQFYLLFTCLLNRKPNHQICFFVVSVCFCVSVDATPVFLLFIHGGYVVHSYPVLALCNTNKQLQLKKDHLLYARELILIQSV